ncbi:uncharacterized protein LOC132624322 [Lycium barbarum]|uniref:uncharacterized protein LOC132624322 n=1 Tax=Lycium barbarum TaxID=112863 RepID=UPI00293EE3D3|nr:uncharacterized protein LOC132624322 [Lycium barbarum]
MQGCAVNSSNKIWIFWSTDLICDVYANDEQMLTCKIHTSSNNSFIYLSVVYAKSRSLAREQLWEHMRVLASTFNNPWMVCGDFNSILGPEEKLGECLIDCGLVDMGYNGNAFTWCNERKMEDIIWKRLDRMLANDDMGSMFSSISVQHLAREDFQDTVKEQWNQNIYGNIFWSIQQKMKKVSKALSEWSRNKIGDIFIKANQLEEFVIQQEEKYMNTLDQTDRMLLNKAKADVVLHHKKVDAYWRQKAHLEWQLEGDENTKFFHSVVRGRRHHMRIQRIKYDDEWIEEEEDIARAAINFYQNLFTQNHTYIDLSILDCIPNLVTCEDNQILNEEISSKEHPQEFSEFRPISLSNVTHNIVSKVLNNRFSKILPKIISSNQSGFMKGSAIGENVLLAQEIVHDIRKPNKGGNVVIKLDMSKAYDRISWNFICVVMRKMGFNEHWIFIIWNLMSNAWYTICINGKRNGFFKSQRGVKQGDPISPGLFIIASEVLSRLLNKLFEDNKFNGFNMPTNGPPINHLSYADDIIIFSSGKTYTLMKIMKCLKDYQENSGQMINEGKSCFLMDDSISTKRCDDEGSIGVTSLQEIAESFSAKLWWTFRTAESLWTKFMKDKYSMRIHPMARKWNYTHSHTWRKLMKIRDKVDHLLHWKINKGNTHIWWDNWMGTGKLARFNTNTSINSPLHHYIHHKEWDTNKLLKIFPLEMVNNIQNIKIHSLDHSDLPIWTPTCDGKFTCKSA